MLRPPPVASAAATMPSTAMTATTAVSCSLLLTLYLPSELHRTKGIRAGGAPGSEPGEGGDPLAVRGRVAVGVGIRLAALEEEVQVVLPGEADAAVDLERGARD